jgi:hypothetical protein
MIVGDRAALKELGRQLQEALPLDQPSAPGWPVAVAKPTVVGPEKGRDFYLSFHLKGDLPLETALPLRSRTWRSVLFLIAAICAITGAVTIWGAVVRFLTHGL